MFMFSSISLGVFVVTGILGAGKGADGTRVILKSNFRRCKLVMTSKQPTGEFFNEPRITRTDTSSSLKSSSINLLKNCLGAGVFSLSSRVLSRTTNLDVLPVSVLVISMSLWATYCFNLVGVTCELTGSKTYGEAWTKTISKDTYWIVQSILVIAPIVSCLANVIVLSDILALVMGTLMLPPAVFLNRNVVIAILGCTILYPLCIQRDLSRLKAVSLIGVLGHLIAMSAFAIRLYDGSYALGGTYHVGNEVLQSASQGAVGIDWSSWFVLASLLSYCFVTHYNVRHILVFMWLHFNICGRVE